MTWLCSLSLVALVGVTVVVAAAYASSRSSALSIDTALRSNTLVAPSTWTLFQKRISSVSFDLRPLKYAFSLASSS
jgi:hypothetical protein